MHVYLGGQRRVDELIRVDVLGDFREQPTGERLSGLIGGECHLSAILLQRGEIVDEPLDELLFVRCLVCFKLRLCFCDPIRRFFLCLYLLLGQACSVFFSDKGLKFEILLIGYHEPLLSNLIVLFLQNPAKLLYQLPTKCEHLRVVLLGTLQHANLLSIIFYQA